MRSSLFFRGSRIAAALYTIAVTALLSSSAVAAPTTTTWTGGSGLWFDGANWSHGVPNSAGAEVLVDGGNSNAALVLFGSGANNVGSAAHIGRLVIDTGDTVQFTNSSNLLHINDTAFTGAGEIVVNGQLLLPYGGNTLDGTKLFSGTGKVEFGSVGHIPEFHGHTTNSSTIEGSFGFGRYNSTRHQMFNLRTINANIPGQHMLFHVLDTPSVNEGTLKATNGAALWLHQGTWIGNGGEVIADGLNSLVWFSSGNVFDGGDLAAINGGKLRVGGEGSFASGATWRNVSVAGPTDVIMGTLFLGGTVTNNGTITVNNDVSRIDSHHHATDRVTLAGNGTVVLNKVPDRTNTAFGDVFGRWLIDDQLIRGRGSIGRLSGDGMDIMNRGTFQADMNGQTMHLDILKLDNQSGGVLRAKDGGILALSIGQTLKNTGGLIEALSGGSINATFARIEGGLIHNNGGYISLDRMVLVNPDADQTRKFDDVPSGGMSLRGTLDLMNSHTVRLVNTIRNEGELRVRSTGSDTIVRIGEQANPHATLTGGGTITLGDPAHSNLNSGIWEGLHPATLINEDNLIRGFGQVGEAYYRQLDFVNRGTVSADAAGKTLLVHTRSLDNTQGDLRSEKGATLNILSSTPIQNAGSLIEARADSIARFGHFTEVVGGTLRKVTDASETGNFELSYGTLTNLKLQGPFNMSESAESRFVGTIENEGTVTIKDTSDNTRVRIGRNGAPDVHLTGGGSIIVNDPTPDTYYGSILDGVDNSKLYLDSQSLRGYGLVGNHYFQLSLINNDLITADASGQTLHLWVNKLTNSPGEIMEAKNSGTLSIAALETTNTNASIIARLGSTVDFRDGEYSNRRLYGGLVRSELGGTISIYRGLRAEQGVTFDNIGTTIVGHSEERTIFGTENGGATFLNKGMLKKVGSSDAHFRIPITSTGLIRAEQAGLRLEVGGTVTNGTFDLAGGHVGFTQAPIFTFAGTNNATGTGKFFMQFGNIVLADAATTLNTQLFDFYNANNISGPGTVNVAGSLDIYPYSGAQTFTGLKLVNLESANSRVQNENTVRFRSGARFENRGSFTQRGGTTIDGEAGTLLANSGILIGESYTNYIDMVVANTGTIHAKGGGMHFRRNMTFDNGAVMADSGAEFRSVNSAVSFSGDQNNLLGNGFNVFENGSITLAAGAKIHGGKLSFEGTRTASGLGEINVYSDLRFHGYGANHNFDAVTLKLASGAVGRFDASEGVLRLLNGAVFENNGTFDFQNSGSTTITSTGGFFITGATGNTKFSGSNKYVNTKPIVFGHMSIGNAMEVKLDKGGEFHAGSKLVSTTSDVSALWRFTGTEPFNFNPKPNGFGDGASHQFNGPGVILMDGATFNLIDPGAPEREIDIVSNHRLHFLGSNILNGRGRIEVNTNYGTNSGVLFQDQGAIKHALTLDGVTLVNNSPGNAIWQSNGGTINLLNGADFINKTRFTITNTVGSFSGGAGSLFHNQSSGRLVHDTPSTTNFDIDFHNDGVLDFAKGTFNFLKKFSGNGGIAASGGARVTLSLAGTPAHQLPSLFQTDGAGSEINLTLPTLESVTVGMNLNGGRMVAAGAGNIVAAGGMNLVAAGAGNIVAAGGMNMVAAGAGNIIANGNGSLFRLEGGMLVAAGAGNILSHNGGQMVAAGAGNILSHNGGQMVAAGAGNIIAAGAGNIISQNGGLMVAAGAGNLVAAGGGNILSHNGGQLVAAGAGNILSHNGGQLVAAGGGNLVAAGAGNLVAAGGGNLVAAGAGNFVPMPPPTLDYNAAEAQARAVAAVAPETSAAEPAATTQSIDDLAGTTGVAALIAKIDALNTNPNVGVLFVEKQGNAKAENGGSIVAEQDGIIGGGGTFTGPGVIKSGGALVPGDLVGPLTWNGNLDVQSGGVLDIEIGGTTAGTQYDSINVSGVLTFNGALSVRFVNGFAANVQSADVFDIVTSGSPISTTVGGTRVAVAGTNGTFAVELADGGKTLRLTDYQLAAPTFNSWASQRGLSGADAAMTADPDGDGLANMLEYALGQDPKGGNGSATKPGVVESGGLKYLSMSYTRPTGADAPSDVTYTAERATALAPAAWSSSSVDVIVHGTTSGPGSLETVTVRSTHPLGETPKEFLHLKVTLTNP
jgi:hypothetical protein